MQPDTGSWTRRAAVAVLALLFAFGPLTAGAENDVARALDRLHRAASEADEVTYFSQFSGDAVFFGTDATERWTVEAFRAYVKPYFDRGQGWTYTVPEGGRHIYLSADGNLAWFDEILNNEKYGVCRGTGVLRREDGEWKVVQYHLTVPIPNEIALDVVAMIRELQRAEKR